MVTFFLVNPSRKSSSISILVSFNGKKYRRSVGESILVKFWNNTKKRAKATSDYTYGNILNDVLDKWEVAALRTMSHFKEYYYPPLQEDFFAQLDKEYYKDDIKEQEIVTLTEYIETYIERYRNSRAKISIKKYITALNKIKEYEEKKKKKLYFKDVSIDFYNDFQQWFYKKGYSDNYFGSVIKVVKQVYREAKVVDKLHNYDNIEHRDFVTTKRNTENIYLTEDELLKIHQLEITPELISRHFPDLPSFHVEQKIKSMKIVRDKFLIGAYTGLRVSDFGRINEMNIGKFIKIKTVKTGIDTVIPIHPVIEEILKNGFNPNITVSDQKINKHIKEVAMIAGINEKVLIHKYISGEVKAEISEKYKLVCTHTARRSFATNAYKAGVPTIAIMKITGHTTEATFLKYIKVSAEENASMLMNHPFFSYKKVNAEQIAEPNPPNEKKQRI
ncbi:MAG: site-specific integrase [Mediterranea sp.]|jgi:site-specific recombinase XerD|nr:site-specific integrase [Mediterranea sp.]